jgi:hypothetical protein
MSGISDDACRAILAAQSESYDMGNLDAKHDPKQQQRIETLNLQLDSFPLFPQPLTFHLSGPLVTRSFGDSHTHKLGITTLRLV